MNVNQENDQVVWGFERHTYTKEQLRQFIKGYMANGGRCRPTLECAELIWPKRHYSFAAYWFDKLQAACGGDSETKSVDDLLNQVFSVV